MAKRATKAEMAERKAKENVEEESPGEKMNKIRITKTYQRKINLEHLSSRFDNIALGTFGSMEIEYLDEEDLKEKTKKLADFVRKEVETDIKDTLLVLMEMAKDKKNSALLALGRALDVSDSIDTTESVEKDKVELVSALVEEEEEKEEEYGEVDIDDLDIDELLSS